MEIRDIDRAGRLYDRASVPRAMMRSLVWGIPLFFIGVFGWAAIGPGENIPLAQWWAALATPVAMAVLVIAVMIAAFVVSGIAGRIGCLVLIALSAIWIAEPFLFLQQAKVGGISWLAGGLVRIPLVILISLEIGAGALALLLARRADLLLVREPVTLATLLGAPPALRTLAKGRRNAWAGFTITALLFALAVMQLSMLNNLPALMWNFAVDACAVLPTDQQIACIQQWGWYDLMFQLTIWPLAIITFVALARLMRSRARALTIRSAEQAMDADPRQPILFLRWFGNDEGGLTVAKQTPVRWLLATTLSEPTIDRLLVEQYSERAPTIALGRKNEAGEPVPPEYGVWKNFPPDKDWKEFLRNWARDAHVIIMVVDVVERETGLDVTDGVKFELDLLATPELRRKTLFMVGTKSAHDAVRHARAWSIIENLSRLGLPADLLGPSSGKTPSRLLATFEKPDGTRAVATSQRFTSSDYAMAIRWFFAGRPPAQLRNMPAGHQT